MVLNEDLGRTGHCYCDQGESSISSHTSIEGHTGPTRDQHGSNLESISYLVASNEVTGGPTRGAQEPLATFLTHSSRITARVNHAAANPIKMTAINGIGVSIVPTSTEPRRARIKSVKRSPRQVATGAVMLSGHVSAQPALEGYKSG